MAVQYCRSVLRTLQDGIINQQLNQLPRNNPDRPFTLVKSDGICTFSWKIMIFLEHGASSQGRSIAISSISLHVIARFAQCKGAVRVPQIPIASELVELLIDYAILERAGHTPAILECCRQWNNVKSVTGVCCPLMCRRPWYLLEL